MTISGQQTRSEASPNAAFGAVGLMMTLLAAGIAAGVQLVLLLVLGDPGLGTLPQALAVCVTAASCFVGGLQLGASAPRGHDNSRPQSWGMPWRTLLQCGLLFAMFAGVWLFLDSGSSENVLRSTALKTSVSLLLPFVFLSLGFALSCRRQLGWRRGIAVGFSLLLVLHALGLRMASSISYDPDVVNGIFLCASLLSFLFTGLIVAVSLKRLAFTELVCIAFLFGFTLYLLAATWGLPILKGFNIPKEQVLVVLAFVPTIIALCFLAVGGSVGFLLTGAGSFDAQFGYELLVGRRFLRSEIRFKDVFWFLATGGIAYLIWQVIKRFRPHHRKQATQQTAVGSIMVISIAGVALGVMALVVVLSVMSGFEEDLKTKILGAHSHIVVQKRGDDFVEYTEIETKLATIDGVQASAAFVLGEAMISSDGGLSGVLIKGLDPKNSAARDLRKNVERGDLDHLLSPEKIPAYRNGWRGVDTDVVSSTITDTKTGEARTSASNRIPSKRKLPGIVIGRELARTLRVGVGSIVSAVSPTSEEIGPTGPQPKLRRFRVAAIFFSGMYEYDAKFAYVTMRRAQRFLGMRKKASGVELRVHDVDDTTMIVEEVKRRLGGVPYTVKDWREMNKELFSALLLEKLAMFIVLIFIVLVASFNIVSTLVMIVLERGREIAILKSMGASRSSIMKIFVVQGLIVGVGGAMLGLACGVSICWLISNYGLPLDKDIFYIDQLPVVMDWGEISIIAVAAIMVTYLATIYPAMAAADLRPVEGLRGD